jgi:Uma2 family endonuclease
MSRAKAGPLKASARGLPPLEHGDHLTAREFERRYEASPKLKKAELIDGMVYLASEYKGRLLDPSVPPLQNGDHLTRAEFDRRWDNMPDLKKAELINGEIFMPPPVSTENHAAPHADLMFWLGLYRSATLGVLVADNGTLRVDPDDNAQPDAMLLVLPTHGGTAPRDPRGYVRGAPELVAETAASSASYDLHAKRDLYRRAGAREYIAWRVLDGAIDWFELRRRRYQVLALPADGICRSNVFPGLWLDPHALVRGDLSAVMRVAQQGTATPEHAAFVARLHAAGNTSR